VPVSAGIARRR